MPTRTMHAPSGPCLQSVTVVICSQTFPVCANHACTIACSSLQHLNFRHFEHQVEDSLLTMERQRKRGAGNLPAAAQPAHKKVLNLGQRRVEAGHARGTKNDPVVLVSEGPPEEGATANLPIIMHAC